MTDFRLRELLSLALRGEAVSLADLDAVAPAVRSSRLLSRADLAIATGLRYHVVSAIEQGKRNPTPEQAHRIASALGVPVDEIFQRRPG
ncbi:MAG: hypothetical protein Kow00128_10590 [Deltaproteobacteria bacterium]